MELLSQKNLQNKEKGKTMERLKEQFQENNFSYAI